MSNPTITATASPALADWRDAWMTVEALMREGVPSSAPTIAAIVCTLAVRHPEWVAAWAAVVTPPINVDGLDSIIRMLPVERRQ